MADDSDGSRESTTDPLPAIKPDFATGGQTVPMPMAQSDEEIPTNPRQGVEDSIDFDAQVTGERPKPNLAEFAQPEDDTGYIDPHGLGTPPEQATTVLPKMTRPKPKLPVETVMTEILDPPTLSGEEDQDTTNVASVSDDAIVRRVKLPEASLLVPKPQPRAPVQDATRPSQLQPRPQIPGPPQPVAPPPAAQSQPQFPAKPAPVEESRWRASSGFWSKKNLTALVSLPSVAVDPAEIEARQGRAFMIAFGLTAVWLMVLAWLAIASWMAPGDALLLAVASIVPTTVLVAGLTRPEDRPPALDDVKMLAKPIGLAFVAILLLPLPWQVGYVRLLVRGLASESPDIASKVLRDRSDAVSLAECRRVVAAFPQPGVVEMLASGLPGRADVTRECLGSVPETSSAVSAKLIGGWGLALMDKRSSTELSCGIAAAMPALNRPPGEIETRLLGCIMTAPPEARTCCGEALAEAHQGGDDWVAKLDTNDGYVPDEPTAASLLALTFGGPDVSETQQALVQQAGFVGAPAQRMALVLGCASSKSGANLGDEFVESLGNCSVDPATLPRDRAAWLEVCERVKDRVIRRRQDPRESLCLATRDVSTGRAITTGEAAVGSALQRARDRL